MKKNSVNKNDTIYQFTIVRGDLNLCT